MSEYGYEVTMSDMAQEMGCEPDICEKCGLDDSFCSCQLAHTDSVIERIRVERRRQIHIGYDARHDNDHDNEELADAAAAYCFGAVKLKTNQPHKTVDIPIDWLTNTSIKKKSRIRQLEIAAALIVAEIERLERCEQTLENAPAVDFNSSRA